MSWVRIDDHAPEHPKLLRVGPVACWLWVCGLAYCSRHLTDGCIPNEALFTLGIPKPESEATKLVRAGLWCQDDNGYVVHDYHSYQPAKSQVLERRKRTAERVAAWKVSRGYVGSNAGGNNVTSGVGTPPPVPVPVPDPLPVPQEPVSAPPRVNARPLGARSEHASHALCGRPCLPAFLYREFVQLKGGPEDEARADVERWAFGIIKAQPDDAAIGDPLKFWRGQWEARFPTATFTAGGPGGGKSQRLREAEIARKRGPDYPDEDWCDHEPRCNSREWHELLALRTHAAPKE